MEADVTSPLSPLQTEAVKKHIERVKLKRAQAQAHHGLRTKKVQWSQKKYQSVRDQLGYGMFDKKREQVVSVAVNMDIVTNADEAAGVPTWKQGDLSQYTDAALAKREEIRNDLKIKLLLKKFWDVCEKGSDGCLHKDEYIKLSRRLYRALVENVFNEKDCAQSAEDDWKEDSEGKTSISRKRFMDCMWTLVDMWTGTTAIQDYVVFLECIFRRIAMAVPGHTDKYQWKPEKSVEWLPIHESDSAAKRLLAAEDSDPDDEDDEPFSDEDETETRTRQMRTPRLRDLVMSLEKNVQKQLLSSKDNGLMTLTSGEVKQMLKMLPDTHFDKLDAELICRQFKTHSQRHLLTSGLRLTAFQHCMGQWNIPTNMCRLMFRAFDEDGNHMVDAQEYLQALSIFLRGSFEEKVKLCFDAWDTDQSGKLSPRELKALLQSVHAEITAAKLDDDVEYVMEKIDVNRDGLVSYEEFIKGVNRIPVLNLMFRRCYGLAGKK